MFGFFGSRECPIPEESREWVERRFAWAQNVFGNKIGRQMILPTPEFFPDEYKGDDESAERIFERVCGYLDVKTSRVELQLISGRQGSRGDDLVIQSKGPRAAGTYQPTEDKEIITIDRSNLREPMLLVATIAHELCHVHLLGDGHLTREEEDHEPMTDLLTVCLGMGIFGANACARYAAWHDGRMSGWETSSLGYLQQSTWGFALGLFAHLRGEEKPSWVKYLGADVRDILSRTLRYLSRREEQGR
jgi:hypothetical protein